MTEAEIGEALGLTDRTVRRDWEKARLLPADGLILGTSKVVAYPGPVRRGKEWERWKSEQDPKALIVTQKGLRVAEAMRSCTPTQRATSSV